MNGDAKGGMRIGNEGTEIEKEEWGKAERGIGMGMNGDRKGEMKIRMEEQE